MTRFLAVILAVTMLIGSSACFRVSIKSGTVPQGAVQHELNFHFLAGLTAGTVNAPECQYGIARAETVIPWWSMALLLPLTFSVVGATRTEYVCAGPPLAR